MWKYNYTHEMFRKPAKETELYHSNKYLGLDFSDGIRHFKYIKREMRNGHWVYYYDKSLNEQKKILESNIHQQKSMIKNNVVYKNPKTGKTYGPDHYKKALEYDQRDLKKVNSKIKKSNGTAKVLNTISDTKYKGKRYIEKLLKKNKKK